MYICTEQGEELREIFDKYKDVELKSCPFCGGKAKMWGTVRDKKEDGTKHITGFIACNRTGCLCRTRDFLLGTTWRFKEIMDDAIAVWNKRVGD